jgi:RNA polymerase sigma factor (sigma-70 family)
MRSTVVTLLQHLRRRAAAPDPGSDAELLARFARQGDEDAFTALVARHGHLVLHTCWRVLGDAHAAEDAFQATFLVLARRAGSLQRPERLTGWLYGVASRIARDARRARKRRPELQPTEAASDPRPDPLAELTARELLTVLEEELQRLPGPYRLPVVLCCLEGQSQEEAARQLGWTAGQVKGRLERGRKRLHERLARRGLGLSPALAAAEAGRLTAAPLVGALAGPPATAATLFAAGRAVGALCPGRVISLAEGALHVMWLGKLKMLAWIAMMSCVLGGVLALKAAVRPGSAGADGAPQLAARDSGAGGEGATRAAGTPPAAKKGDEPPPPPKGPGLDLPPPGGDAPITRDRLTRACLLGDQHVWYFRGKKFILAADKGQLPAGLVRALLGPDGKAARILGKWDLDTEKGQLVLTALVADGKRGPKEARLGISPAGKVRVNIDKAGQLDIMSFEDKLHVPRPGEIFPIYDFANRIDLEFLQGAWDLRSSEADGKALAAIALAGSEVVVKGSAITVVFQGATSRGTFQLDSVPTPPTLDVTFTEGREKGNKYLGIYELQEDTWRLCQAPAGKGRPTAFAARAGSGQLLETLGRAVDGSAGPLPPAGDQEKDAPTGPPPQLWLASASEEKGKVVIQIASPQERGGTDLVRGLEPGVGSLPGTVVMKWSNLPKVTLGKTVHAFRVDGGLARPDAVLKALARPKGVAVFIRTKDKDPTSPDPFYLAMLREDAVVLVLNQRDIYPQEP